MPARVAVLLFMAGSAWAQLGGGSSDLVHRVRVRVEFVNYGSCDSSTRVALTGEMGLALAEGPVNEECIVEFFDVPPGKYHVSVRGADVSNGDSGDVEINAVIGQDLEVKAARTGAADLLNAARAGSLVSAVDLGVPSGAAKEFGKATQLIARQEWRKSLERLRRAIAIYPNYSAAYNNLGVVYARLGDRGQAEEALQRAISINDHLAAAYVNLARISIATHEFLAAEESLNRACSAGSPDVASLVLLAYVQLMNHHLDQTISTSRRAHGLQGPHAFVHLAAAQAFEQKRQMDNVAAELKIFLDEEPTGARAEQARKALVTLQSDTRQGSQTGVTEPAP